MEGKTGKGFQEHVQRTHGGSQWRVGPRVGSGDAWGGGSCGGKWRQLKEL